MPSVTARNRRYFLSSSLLAFSAVAVSPVAFHDAESTPAWISQLEEELQTYCTAIERRMCTSGAVELHCAMLDPVAFGMTHGNFAGLGLRFRAQGSRLSARQNGVSLTIILQTA